MKPKNFDPEKTLQKITDTFAKHGYEGTSLDMLIKETGLGKQSIYNTFGDKKSMLAKALGYSGKKSEAFDFLLNTNLSGRERLESFFLAIVSECNKKSPGCLATNVLLEKGASDEEISKVATATWEKMRTLLESVVSDGIKDKSIFNSNKAELLSYMLINFLSGLRVTLRATADKEKAKQMVRASLKIML